MLLQLFENEPTIKNLLPYDGEVNYYGKIYDTDSSNILFEKLLQTINWQNDEVKLFGITHITARKMAWFSENNRPYKYAGRMKYAAPFTKELLDIKTKVESLTGETYDSCLANLYHTGQEGMGWHADNEAEIVKNSAIASISLGAERMFHFKHRSENEKLKFNLENGSLIVMKGAIQQHWLHAMPKSMKILTARINLTFRKMNQ
jgi:alkylated DNA repair dioxygenase AlkB